MLQYWRCFTSLVMHLAQGLVSLGRKVYPLVIGLEFGMRRDMERALITESFFKYSGDT